MVSRHTNFLCGKGRLLILGFLQILMLLTPLHVFAADPVSSDGGIPIDPSTCRLNALFDTATATFEGVLTCGDQNWRGTFSSAPLAPENPFPLDLNWLNPGIIDTPMYPPTIIYDTQGSDPNPPVLELPPAEPTSLADATPTVTPVPTEIPTAIATVTPTITPVDTPPSTYFPTYFPAATPTEWLPSAPATPVYTPQPTDTPTHVPTATATVWLPTPTANDDSDGDGVDDTSDGCPFDPYKIAPDICGCGMSDKDSDGDGVSDCHDLCPYNFDKTEPGTCGCESPDSDLDGTPDCIDPCPNDAVAQDPFQCGLSTSDPMEGGPGETNTLSSIWDLKSGEDREQLRQFLDLYKKVRGCSLTDPNTCFGDNIKALYESAIKTGFRVSLTGERAREIFFTLLANLSVVRNLNEGQRQLALRFCAHLLPELRTLEDGPSYDAHFFTHYVNVELSLPEDMVEDFCLYFTALTDILAVSSSDPAFLNALEMAPYQFLSSYERSESKRNLELCLLHWAIKYPPTYSGSRPLLQKVASEIVAGSISPVSFFTRFLENVEDPEVVSILIDTGLLDAVVFVSAIKSPSSGNAALALSRFKTESKHHWTNVFSGLLNNSQTAISHAHIQSLVQIAQDDPTITPELVAAARDAMKTVGQSAFYYLAIESLLQKFS